MINMRQLCLIFTLCAAAWARPANDDAAANSPASNAPTIFKLGDITVSGSLRLRFYAWDWFQPATGQNQYEYSGNLLRLKFSEQRSNWDWAAEFAAPFLFGLPTTATDAAPQGALGLGSNYFTANHAERNTALVFPKQLYIGFDRLGGREGQTLQVGRFLFLDGSEIAPQNATLAALKSTRVSQRLVGDFGWSDVGRSFDGLRYSRTSATNNDNLTFVAAVPTRGVYQVDGWGWNDVAFGYGSYTHEWGSNNHHADTRFFALEYADWRPDLKTDNRPASIRSRDTAAIRIDTFGGHSLHAIETSAGTIDLLAWGAIQTGQWGSLTQRAYAFDLESGWQPETLPRLKPWLRAGFTKGSGDRNANDSTHGTFFQVLPTPRPYARFPFFNMMNTEDLMGALILRPSTKVTISSEFHALRLSSANDLWYSGGGVFQPWTFGYTGRSTAGRSSLGNLYDTSVEVRPGRKTTVTTYFGYTQGLASMEQIYPADKDARFGYLELAYRF